MGQNSRVLVVDNDKSISWVLEKTFTEEGYLVDVAHDGKKALEMVKENSYKLLVMDIMMPVMDGLQALQQVKEISGHPETIIMTAHSSMENTVEAMKLGAFDYIVKPFDIDEILELAKKAIEKFENRDDKKKFTFVGKTDRIIGDSPKMRELYKILGRVTLTDSTVLITGETGTGKDLFARAIHYHSYRKDKPFITVNCASIPGELLESELFGYERGAFTGAVKDNIGKCELADTGTLFLDEIGTMRLDLQAKLLRFLQRSEFERVGSSKTIKVDVRVIAATNSDLKKLIEKGLFREDLYYRLMVVPVHIPPLRERKEDIAALATYFVDLYNSKYGLSFNLTKEHIASLESKEWPGNIRELENYIIRTVVLQSDDLSSQDTFIKNIPAQDFSDPLDSIAAGLVDSGISGLLDIAREKIEKPLLSKLMSKVRYNQSEAANILGISRNTLRKMLEKYNLLS